MTEGAWWRTGWACLHPQAERGHGRPAAVCSTRCDYACRTNAGRTGTTVWVGLLDSAVHRAIGVRAAAKVLPAPVVALGGEGACLYDSCPSCHTITRQAAVGKAVGKAVHRHAGRHQHGLPMVGWIVFLNCWWQLLWRPDLSEGLCGCRPLGPVPVACGNAVCGLCAGWCRVGA